EEDSRGIVGYGDGARVGEAAHSAINANAGTARGCHRPGVEEGEQASIYPKGGVGVGGDNAVVGEGVQTAVDADGEVAERLYAARRTVQDEGDAAAGAGVADGRSRGVPDGAIVGEGVPVGEANAVGIGGTLRYHLVYRVSICSD